jgi:hypothetical protein
MDLPGSNCLCEIQIGNELSSFPYWSLQVHPPPQHEYLKKPSTFSQNWYELMRLQTEPLCKFKPSWILHITHLYIRGENDIAT